MQGRVLVGEGVLTKMCRKKPKPRQFFLFNDILVYGNIIINKKKYNKQHIIPLEEVKLESIKDDGRKRYMYFFKYTEHLSHVFARKHLFMNTVSEAKIFGFLKQLPGWGCGGW